MIGIIGIIMIFVMVFGGYIEAGGKMEIILEALPHEMIVIGGATIGSFLLGNSLATVKQTAKDIGKVFKGAKWKNTDYRDLLALLFDLVRIARSNPVALEEHVENPEESSIFGRYPKIQHDHAVVELICDTLRAASMNYDDPHQVEEVLDKRMEEAQAPRLARQSCVAVHGGCPASHRHRRGRAGRDQDHGLNRPTAGNSGWHDRRRTGRDVHGGVSGLWFRWSDGQHGSRRLLRKTATSTR